jgi:hypothetical protein
MRDDSELTPEEWEELQRKIRAWEVAHPNVKVGQQFMHPYFTEILYKNLRDNLEMRHDGRTNNT